MFLPPQRVLVCELDSIIRRRKLLGLPARSHHDLLGGGGAAPALADARDLPDTLGLAFSGGGGGGGGGVHAAAMATGVLRATAAAGMLERVDYLSCVSGGAAPALAFLSHAAARLRAEPRGAAAGDNKLSEAVACAALQMQ
ncbi:hypothetical protein T484DRAFT_1764002 [Baffinella frigidus]|nr:hypothetical protein T484DRAFT_1764002 [Cryptophyta sp. CCMP2293]